MFIYNNNNNNKFVLYDKFILKGRLFSSFQFRYFFQRNPSRLISKQLGRNDFSMEQLPIDSYMSLCKQKNSISIMKLF